MFRSSCPRRTTLTGKRLLGSATATIIGSCMTLLFPLAASSASLANPGEALILRISGVPAHTSKVLVEAQSALTRQGVPKVIDFYTLATVTATGAAMSVSIPHSAALDSLATQQHGVVELAVVADSSARTYGHLLPVRLISHRVITASVANLARVSFQWPASQAGTETTTAGPLACAFLERSSTEGVTRLGELHISSVSAMAGHYESNYTADNTMTVGASLNGNSGSFSSDGSITLANSISNGGGFKHDGGLSQYVDGHLYYGRFQGEGTNCVAPWLLEATSSVGDAFEGTRSAPGNPYGTCHSDPNGLATIQSNGGYWGYDTSQAQKYDGAFSWYGFGFSGSNGFTSDVQERWDNNGGTTTYVCGNVDPVQDSRIFWNENS